MKALPKVKVQNCLMRIGDRAIALAMMYMEDPDRGYIFTLLPAPKAERIREELALHNRLKITYEQYQAGITVLIDGLDRERGGGTFRSYIRPSR
ncbi:MAG: hypothetical protein HN368_19250 [Spirochaetales bacterium]|jgi:hypothetical protein|nr:hypothetical protein [Spirochaetales bacterium]